jgi:hypothetical protein
MKEAREDAEAALRMSKARMVGTPTRDTTEFEVGQPVWLSTNKLKIRQKNGKLGSKRLGPFEVLERTGLKTYRLQLPPWMKIHNNININRLSPWKGNEINGLQPPAPEPEVIEGEEFYEVDSILDSRYRYRKLRYLVRWRGYDESADTWEPAEELEQTAPDAVAEFHNNHPNAPKKISASIFHTLPWQPLVNFTEQEYQSMGHRL